MKFYTQKNIEWHIMWIYHAFSKHFFVILHLGNFDICKRHTFYFTKAQKHWKMLTPFKLISFAKDLEGSLMCLFLFCTGTYTHYNLKCQSLNFNFNVCIFFFIQLHLKCIQLSFNIDSIKNMLKHFLNRWNLKIIIDFLDIYFFLL